MNESVQEQMQTVAAFGVLDLAAVVLAYILGSLPTGLWLGLWLKGVDIREHGSRNIGATNTMRVLGKGLGAVALIADIVKGLLAVVLVGRLGIWPYLPLLCGLAAILGHTFSVFLRFRGGKGVATSAGVFLGLATYPFIISSIVFFIMVAGTRMVSAASMCAAAALGISVYFFPLSLPVQLAATIVAVLVIIKHRSNLQRILRGEENKL